MLIKLIEYISEKDFNEYINDTFFRPLGMNGIVIKDQYPYLDSHSMAIPFGADGERDQFTMKSSNLLFASTTADIAIWINALNNYELLSKKSVLYLAGTANVLNDNMQSPLGKCTISDNKIVAHHHHGSSGNYEGLVKRYNDLDITVVLLTNQKNRNVFEILDKIYIGVNK